MNNNITKYITTEYISFLMDIDKHINIDKIGKYSYHKIDNGEIDRIKDFILSLDNNEIYILMPFISINCKIGDPYLTLSKQFLVTNQSNYVLIHDFLSKNLNIAIEDFNMNLLDNYFLIFKYKKVKLEYRKY